MGASLQRMLHAILATIDRGGDFYARGALATAPPLIDVVGLGPLAYPLLTQQASALADLAERAPYGRGGDTLVDEAVRKSWQLEPALLDIEPSWSEKLERIVAAASEGLGVDGAIGATLYKALLYEEGGFFLPHRDSEKQARMFATLIIALPSRHTGGELVIEHAEREVTLDLSQVSLDELQWAAFYADCLHELSPITSGYRLALVYNLHRASNRAPTPRAEVATTQLVELVDLLEQWDREGDSAPDKLVWPLAHDYTSASLDVSNLKGADRVVARVVKDACEVAGFDACLGLIHIEESGEAIYYGDGRGRSWRNWSHDDDGEEFDDDDSGDFEIEEVYEREWLLTELTALDHTWDLSSLPLEERELSPPGALAEEITSSARFYEATGNEGASFERSYMRAAIVMWPSSARARVMFSGSLTERVSALERTLRGELTMAHGISLEAGARDVIARWHELGELDRVYSWSRPSFPLGRMLEVLALLEDPELAERFLTLSPPHAYLDEHIEGLSMLVGMCAQAFPSVLALYLPGDPQRASLLLGAFTTHDVNPELGDATLDVLFDNMPTTLAELTSPPPRALRAVVSVTDLVALIDAVCRFGDAARGEAFATCLLSAPRVYPLLETITPALLTLVEREHVRAHVLFTTLQAASVALLEEITATPPVPPADFVRAFKGCGCDDCEHVRAFMEAPERARMLFPAGKERRRHLHHYLDGYDASHETIREGNPHKLEITKTDASFQRASSLYERHLEMLEALGARLDL